MVNFPWGRIVCGVLGHHHPTMARFSFLPVSTFAAILAFSPFPSLAATVETDMGSYDVEEIVDGLDGPWAIDFLPDGGFLVTEIDGRLLHFDAKRARNDVGGLPEIDRRGQGGLLDVTVARDFDMSREVFLSFATPQGGGAGTALAVGRLSEDTATLENVRVIFEMTMGGRRGQHFGSRVVESEDGTLFLTIGDRGNSDLAQDRSRHNGSVIRINRDGSVPADNPFVDQDNIQPEIWSYGHRNPQGAALDASGQLWAVEHGARGGDEINQITAGTNYGWPVISYGTHYNGTQIGVGTEQAGMAQPAYYWDPSIAPSGFAIASIDQAWAGDFFIGSLKFDYLSRLDPETWTEDTIRSRETARVRDVVEGPDGAIWFLSEDNGALYRMTPG